MFQQLCGPASGTLSRKAIATMEAAWQQKPNMFQQLLLPGSKIELGH
jgi:hypothetical protein